MTMTKISTTPMLTSEGGFVKSECYTFETEQPAETEETPA